MPELQNAIANRHRLHANLGSTQHRIVGRSGQQPTTTTGPIMLPCSIADVFITNEVEVREKS